MNKVQVLGRLTSDPVNGVTSTGKNYCYFTLACDREYRNAEGKREADFIPIVVWGKAAELICAGTRKGHRLLVEGRLQISDYVKDGIRRFRTEVVARNIEFIEKKGIKVSTPQTFGPVIPPDEEVKF